MKKVTFTEAQEQQIRSIQESLGVSRKTAIRKMRTTERAAAAEAAKAARTAKRQPKPAPEKLSSEQVSANRKEGIRLFALAGRPKREQFALFGKDFPKWTWERRAKELGLSSAEECAAQFQALLAKRVSKSASASR